MSAGVLLLAAMPGAASAAGPIADFSVAPSTTQAGASPPKSFTGLRPGRHSFGVYATGPTGVAGQIATFAFKLKKPPTR